MNSLIEARQRRVITGSLQPVTKGNAAEGADRKRICFLGRRRISAGLSQFCGALSWSLRRSMLRVMMGALWLFLFTRKQRAKCTLAWIWRLLANERNSHSVIRLVCPNHRSELCFSYLNLVLHSFKLSALSSIFSYKILIDIPLCHPPILCDQFDGFFF